MKITAGFLLFCVAVEVSATPSKHHAILRSNAKDDPREIAHPRQQHSGDRGLIAWPDDETESRRLPKDGNGSEDVRRGLRARQTLRNGQEGRNGCRCTGNSNNDDIIESRRPDTISEQPARPFQNRGDNQGAEPASNGGQPGAFSDNGSRLGDIRRGSTNGYRSRVRSEDDSRSSEEDRPQSGRRYRPRVGSDDVSHGSEESREYGRRYRPGFRSDDDRSSSEENRHRRRERRQYPRRSGDGSGEEVRPFGQHRRTASRGFDHSD